MKAKLLRSEEELYRKVTERILKLLEQNIIPWHPPWRVIWPYNLATRRPYGLYNGFYLLASEFCSPAWLTRHQIEKLGGQIRPDQIGNSREVFFMRYNYMVEIKTEAGPKLVRRHLFLVYEVWNLEQTTGLERYATLTPLQSEPVSLEALERARAIVQNMPMRPVISHHPLRAFYNPACDVVYIPRPENFHTPEGYYATLFHELAHATGHPTRLDRACFRHFTGFGSYEYAQEELVAELGSAYLCANAGIASVTLNNSVAYVKNWYRVLQENPQIFSYACLNASQACKFILGKIQPRRATGPAAATTSTPLPQPALATTAAVARLAA